jgi:hypothetical protein
VIELDIAGERRIVNIREILHICLRVMLDKFIYEQKQENSKSLFDHSLDTRLLFQCS